MSTNSNRISKKDSKITAKVDDFSTSLPAPVKTDAELYSEYLLGDDPDLNLPDDDLDGWNEPPIDWEMEGPPDDELEPPDDWDTPTSDTIPDVPLGPLVSDKTANSQLDSFAAHALNGLLAGMLSVPNTSLDTSEIARIAYNYAEAMLRERQRRLDNQVSSLSPTSSEKPDSVF